MPDPAALNHRIVLAARPRGAPVPTDFRTEALPIPVPGDGQLLTRTLYLSLDPYMRGRLPDAPSSASAERIGDVMVGGTVSGVEASRHAGWARSSVRSPGSSVARSSASLAAQKNAVSSPQNWASMPALIITVRACRRASQPPVRRESTSILKTSGARCSMRSCRC